MKCKTCHHPRRYDIDLALLTGHQTYEVLSHTYGLSISSLFRHKRHLEFKLAQTQEHLQHLQRQDILYQFDEFLQEARAQIRTGKEEGNNRHVLLALREGTRIANFINKLDISPDKVTTYHLMASPQWPLQDSLYPTDSRFRAGVRQTLSRKFFNPCPDLPPDPQLNAWDQADAAAADRAQTAHLDNLPAPSPDETASSPAPLPPPAVAAPEAESPQTATLQSLDLRPDTLSMLQEILADQLNAETEPRKKREKSAKCAPKPTPSNNNCQQYRENITGEQILPKNPAPAADPEKLYEDFLQEKAAAEAILSAQDSELNTVSAAGAEAILNPHSPVLSPESAAEPPLIPQSPALSTDKPLPPLDPFDDTGDYLFAVTHGYRRDNPPKHIPDRRWHEDFGSPRRFRGTY